MTGLLRWETPVSDARSLVMVALVDQNGLHITVQDLRDPSRRRYCFSFRQVVAYRNILEELRLGERRDLQGHGWTFRAPIPTGSERCERANRCSIYKRPAASTTS